MKEKKFADVENWRSRLVWGVLLAGVIFFSGHKAGGGPGGPDPGAGGPVLSGTC